MMEKRLAFLAIAVTIGSFVVWVAACGDSGGQNTFPDTTDAADAQFDHPSFDLETGSPDGNIPVSCPPSLPATFAPTWTPPTRAQVCSPANLSDYYDACRANQTDPDAGPAGPACKAWKAANDTCAKCLEVTDNTGPVQSYKNGLYTLNTAGCISILRNEPEPKKCPDAYNAVFSCVRTSCIDCLAQPNAQFSDFAGCETNAQKTGCAGYDSTRITVCGPSSTLDSPDSGAYDCFQNQDDRKTLYVRVMKIFCGQ
jgi:hypothetical protein